MPVSRCGLLLHVSSHAQAAFPGCSVHASVSFHTNLGQLVGPALVSCLRSTLWRIPYAVKRRTIERRLTSKLEYAVWQATLNCTFLSDTDQVSGRLAIHALLEAAIFVVPAAGQSCGGVHQILECGGMETIFTIVDCRFRASIVNRQS